MPKVRQFISAKQIQRHILCLAKEIHNDYKDQDFIIINVLRGADKFVFDLENALAKLRYPPKVLSIQIKSYTTKDPMVAGPIRMYTDISEEEINNRHILIVDDIIDSGQSIQHLIKHLQSKYPRSIKTCVLLDKPSGRKSIMSDLSGKQYIVTQHKNMIMPDYYGFIIPDMFVIGYGMDLDGEFRDLPYIGELV